MAFWYEFFPFFFKGGGVLVETVESFITYKRKKKQSFIEIHERRIRLSRDHINHLSYIYIYTCISKIYYENQRCVLIKILAVTNLIKVTSIDPLWS